MRKILLSLLSIFTGPRYFPDTEWSSNSWTHNIFQVFEAFFGAPAVFSDEGTLVAKIIRQSSCSKQGNMYVVQAHTFEATCALLETWARDLLKFRFFKPVKLWIPRLSMSNGLPEPLANYMLAIAFDAAPARAVAVSTNSLTYAATCTGSNRMLITGVKTSSTDDVSSVVYNASGATQVGKAQQPIPGSRWTYMYYQLAPSTGSNNNVISTSDSPDFIIAKSASYTGVKQSAQPDASTTATGSAVTTKTTTITVVDANSWAIIYATGDSAPSASTNVTDRQVDGTPELLGDSNGVTGSGSYGQTVTFVGLAACATVMASFAPAPVSGPVNLKTLDTNVKANVKTYNTNPLDNIKSVNTNV